MENDLIKSETYKELLQLKIDVFKVELVLHKWERYFKNTLKALVVLLLMYGAYRYGYNAGMTDLYNYLINQQDESKSKATGWM